MSDETVVLEEPKPKGRTPTPVSVAHVSAGRLVGGEQTSETEAGLQRAVADHGQQKEDRGADLEDLDRLADWLDSRYRIPGTSIRFGWDSLLGLIPGIGDTAALVPAVWLIATGYHRGASNGTLVRMGVNTGLDFVIGGIPVLGDIFDVFFKANRRNIALLKDDLGKVRS